MSLTDLSHRTVSPLNANGEDFAVDDKISIYKVNIAKKNPSDLHVELILGQRIWDFVKSPGSSATDSHCLIKESGQMGRK